MRPHRLELQAFSAFPDTVELDLDELGRNGLLLLCGDTGGGKTTLLDALGFALYGVVPGERAKARDELRSHHARETDTTWVRLEFSARGRRLRVTRSPEQQRRAKRGSGVARQQASALLEELVDGTWHPVAQRLDEVGLEVGRLVGMDAAQFFQVVLLPQGRFAAFLQADHKEREKLLKQLFHVRRFEHVERWLAERAADAGARLTEARARLSAVAARVAQQAAAELPGDVEADPTWAVSLAGGAAAESEALAGATAARLADRQDAEAALHEALELARRQDERRQAELQLAELRERDADVAALAVELERAERAVPVAVAGAAVAARRAEVDAATAEAAVARRRVRSAADAVGRADTDADVPSAAVLRTAGAAARTEVGRLELLADVATRAAQLERDAAVAAATAEQRAAEAAAAERRLGELADAAEAATARHRRARGAASALPELRAALDAARAGARATADAALAADEAERLAAEAAVARTEADEARDRARDLRNERVDAMAAELAAALVDDSECPVCGSLEHPAPAEVRAGSVTREQERQAQRDADVADELSRDLEQRVAAARERATLLARQAVGTSADPDALAAEVAALEPAAADEGAAQAAVDGVAEETTRVREQLLEARLRADEHARAAEAAAASAASERVRLRAELGGSDGGDVDLAALLTGTAALAQAYEHAAGCLEAVDAASRLRTDAEQTARELAATGGFSSLEQAQQAARDEPWRSAAREQVDAHGRRVAAVHARLADDDLAVALEPPAPVALRREVAGAAAARHEEALAQERLARERADRLAALLPEWTEAQAAVGPLREELTQVRGLAELAAGRGGNRLSMPLSTFVLAARLEEVASAASVRLARMTDGRYTLVHTDSSRDRRTRAGLGLQVEDSWTGRLRDTATLSGGETFMTALALALGLADVVTAEAGGHTIDALFVDEGFGSLDATTLDRVMDVLDDLRSGGRLVGLVSHVADLRLRIPTQIVVDKRTTGSAVRTTLSAA